MWRADTIQSLIREGLAANSYQAAGMLKLSRVITPADPDTRVLTWARAYRAARPFVYPRHMTMTPPEAAALADAQITEGG